MRGYFVTGTDTGIGKTAVAAALCFLLRGRGVDAVPAKPVQTGAAAGQSADLEHCLAVCRLRPAASELELMNPYRFLLPASPHLAAEREGRSVDVDRIVDCCAGLADRRDMLVVEGAGGLLVPLSRDVTTLELAARLALPLVIVARPGLGTINHCLLTVRTAKEAGLEVAAVAFNRTEPAPAGDDDRLIETDNARVIAEMGGVNVVGPLPHLPGAGESVEVSRALAKELETYSVFTP